MTNIENKILYSRKWINAQRSLEELNKMMELVKEYPINPLQRPAPSPPYTIPKPYTY